MNSLPPDTHEWVSFDDDDQERTWLFDATFLESNWQCIFGDGCQGVLTDPSPELVQGCCSYGAHFVDEKDRKRVEKAAKRLTDDQWQFRAKGKDGTTRVKKNGEIVTKLVKDACIFLNRPDFKRGPGCALHVMAVDLGQSYIPLKPEVCWQLPLRREDETAPDGRVTSVVRQWDRRHWGDGGAEFHWWCTEAPEAFTGHDPVYRSMRTELETMTGRKVYKRLAAYLDERTGASVRVTLLPHPTVRH